MAAIRSLITGVSGQDGSYLAEALVAAGQDVVGLVREREPDPAAAGLSGLVVGDLGDPASLRRAVADVRPDAVYHLAAPTFVPDSWRDPTGTLAAIAGGTATLLAAVVETVPDARVVVATSAEIFGDAGESPQNERSPMRPRSPYGVAKLAAHGIVQTMREHHGLHVSSAITFNHESPRRPARFLPRKVTRGAAAIKLGLEQELVLGDLAAVRDWCDARDVVRGLQLMAAADTPGDYVLASGVARTVQDLVDAAFAAAGISSDGRVRVDPAFVRPPEATQPLGDPAAALAHLGWRAEIPFEQTIADMLAVDLAELGSSDR
ncbi:GDP-mannose 4,6-dehydratase [Paraconexibacter sp. AEG42_29]|uniref:GDP-mannose 4,6-dehydratase n=1 Tax=Paraconexibacter sp. AEG42_29 TaxID=2997339 RepID=A0AAU7B2H5_9ACTN